MGFQDKVALITGSAQGIGKAAVFAFAKEGATVVLNDINNERLSETASELEKAGAKYLSIVANTAILSEVEDMFNNVVEKFGRLDILVNNAGITRDAFLHKMTEDQWKQVIDVNLTGVFYCLQAAAKIMRNAGSGRIIN